MSSYSDLANASTAILTHLGDAQANAQLQKGQIWGQTLASLGQMVAGIPEQQTRLAHAKQQMEMGQLQMDAAKRQAADESQARQAMMGASQVQGTEPGQAQFTGPVQPGQQQVGPLDPARLQEQLLKRGVSPDRMATVMSHVNAMQKSSLDIEQAKAEHAGSIVSGIIADHYNPQLVEPAIQAASPYNPNIGKLLPWWQSLSPEEQAAQMQEGGTMRAAIDSVFVGSKEAVKNIKEFRESQYKDVRGTPMDLSTGKPMAGFEHAKNATEASLLSDYMNLLVKEKTTGQLSEQEQAQRIAYEETHPNDAKKAANAQHVDFMLNGKSVKGAFVPDEAGGKYIYNGQDVTAQAKPIPPASVQIMNTPVPTITLTDAQKKIASQIAYGDLTMRQFNALYGSRGGQGMALKQSIYQQALETNPNFNPAQFEAGMKMFENPAMRQRLSAINSLKPVIDKAKELSAQVGNGDVQLFNQLLNGAKLQISNKKIANFTQLKTILGDEIGLALGLGTGSDLKTKMGIDLVNTNLSDGSFQSNLDQLWSILDSRRSNLADTMGIYGKTAIGGGGESKGGGVSVTAPNGKTYQFKSQADADIFKQKAGL